MCFASDGRRTATPWEAFLMPKTHRAKEDDGIRGSGSPQWKHCVLERWEKRNEEAGRGGWEEETGVFIGASSSTETDADGLSRCVSAEVFFCPSFSITSTLSYYDENPGKNTTGRENNKLPLWTAIVIICLSLRVFCMRNSTESQSSLPEEKR